MTQSFNRLFFLFFILIFNINLSAQEYFKSRIKNHFKQINVEQGLSAANVNAVAKDSAGFIWIGTEYGLNRYDGNSIKVFKSSSIKTNSISSNTIFDLTTDSNGEIWIATLVGLNKYQHLTEDFKFYNDPNTTNIYSDIEYDSLNNLLWIASNKEGVKYLDLNLSGTSIISTPIKTNSIQVKVVGNKLLVGTKNQGLFIYDKNTFEEIAVIQTPLNSFILGITVLDNNIWIATSKDGILKIEQDDYNNITYYNSKNSKFNAPGALCIEKDKSGNLLIGTDGKGLFTYNIKRNTFDNFVKKAPKNALKSNTIRDIFIDDDQNIWLSTYASGVNMHPFHNQSIANFQSDKNDKNSLSNSFILAIEESNLGKLFIGTNRGGLNIIEKNKISKVKIPSNVVLSLCEDSKGRLWIGTYQNGIFIYENDKLTNYASLINDSTFSSTSVWDIKEGPNGNIWFGLTQLGLLSINKDNYQYTLHQDQLGKANSLVNNSVKSLLWDSHNQLWVVTIHGVSIFSIKKNVLTLIKNLKGVAKKTGTSIAEINSTIYIGTYGSGIYVFNKNAVLIDSLSEENNGLVHNVIVDLIRDENNNLWATTPNGLSKIDIKTLKIENFTSVDGLVGNTFNPRSGSLLKSGRLAFGLTQGLSIFHPDSIAYSKKTPTILLTALKVLNKEISVDSSILHKPITYTKSFSLPPHLNSISISYVGLNYRNPKKVIYKYILEGFEEDWRIAEKNKTASYTNLKPGNYTFKVIASNGNNNWTKEPASVQITVLPYWWETPLSAIIFICIGIGILTLIIKFRTNNLSKQKIVLELEVKERTEKLEKAYKQLSLFNQQLEAKVKERTQKLEKSNSELDRFVYSASHDLGAPLKSIIGLLNLAKIDNPEETTTYFNKIENSIKKLEVVIQNLIQFSRNSRQEVTSQPIDLKLIAKELQEELIYADSSKIDYTVTISNNFNLITDPFRLKIILSNFLSNSIKYRSQNKFCKIQLRGYKKDNQHFISIEDNGVGIEPQYENKIFDMFYRATTLSEGSGLGLYIVKESAEKLNAKITVKSNFGEGSIFTIEFSANT